MFVVVVVVAVVVVVVVVVVAVVVVIVVAVAVVVYIEIEAYDMLRAHTKYQDVMHLVNTQGQRGTYSTCNTLHPTSVCTEGQGPISTGLNIEPPGSSINQ